MRDHQGVEAEPLPGLAADSAAEPAAGTVAEPMAVYTDGACLGNPGPGGWAWAVPGGEWACGADPHTTNQRMELQAVLEALRELDGPVEVVSDSTYVVNCFRDRWYEGWKRRGWRNANKKPVANRDLWEPLIELYLSRADEISFRWVKGHSGNEWNEIVDQLAVGAATDQISRRGP
ncbi:MAG: ribonuclease HI [Acidimicrobiaceae bacterium]|nr:ribonuclease HI [Acidimicrobiaceae bacterium]MYB87392.1 ribonuclease HI [Acidimicrobiaceae bacterium]